MGTIVPCFSFALARRQVEAKVGSPEKPVAADPSEGHEGEAAEFAAARSVHHVHTENSPLGHSRANHGGRMSGRRRIAFVMAWRLFACRVTLSLAALSDDSFDNRGGKRVECAECGARQ